MSTEPAPPSLPVANPPVPPAALPAVDEFGNPVWWASSPGDGLCPVCQHAPDLHEGTEGCQYAFPDTYTHMTDVQLCECPMQPVSSARPDASLSEDPAQSRAEKIAAAIVPEQLDEYLPDAPGPYPSSALPSDGA